MDSGNSGSLQSSSGGDEEFDSRADSFSAFMMNPTTHVGPIPNPPPLHHHPPPPMFDPLSNYFDSRPPQPPPQNHQNSLLNLDMPWSKNPRSDPSPFFSLESQSRGLFTTTSHAIPPLAPATDTATTAPRPSSSSAAPDQSSHSAPRNPKKRSRASRRAPTTVLTTDTTNFRAMVQEFTGIPAPPFTSSSPFPRGRFDLFGTPSTIRSSPLVDTSQPPYNLLRPFAQKLQPQQPFVSSPLSSSLADAMASNTNGISSGTSSNTASSNHFPFEESGGLFKHQPSMQNPINLSTFQSFLQSPLPTIKYPLSNSAILGSKTPQQSVASQANDSHLNKMGILDDFGLSHHGLSSLVSSKGNGPTTNWAGDGNDGSYNYTRNNDVVTNGKLNYSGSSSNFQAGNKGSENLSTSAMRGGEDNITIYLHRDLDNCETPVCLPYGSAKISNL
ncbi:hypothetical protein RJ640_008943 [Escallonia rubra]|uniref:VQ domain-containing protein n=1 Tax=Escallonia rubra TaxID=112253 RepID=A0AA88RTP2_9ASTE|nr:hypothetical protein RJ640_008943 [Escallonia rubra]